MLRHGWTQHVATEVLEADPITGKHSDVGVQVEAAKVSVARAAAADHRRAGSTAETQQALTGARAGDDPADDGRTLKRGQRRRVE